MQRRPMAPIHTPRVVRSRIIRTTNRPERRPTKPRASISSISDTTAPRQACSTRLSPDCSAEVCRRAAAPTAEVSVDSVPATRRVTAVTAIQLTRRRCQVPGLAHRLDFLSDSAARFRSVPLSRQLESLAQEHLAYCLAGDDVARFALEQNLAGVND